MEKKLYLEVDDKLKVGDKPLKHKNPKGQELHDNMMKNKKEYLEQFKMKR